MKPRLDMFISISDVKLAYWQNKTKIVDMNDKENEFIMFANIPN